MKIHQLPYGARFEYEGEEYVKTGPLIGAGSNGQKLIPRYAELRPIGDSAVVREDVTDSVSKADVLQAFNTFFAECRNLLTKDQLSSLEASRERFLKALDQCHDIGPR